MVSKATVKEFADKTGAKMNTMREEGADKATLLNAALVQLAESGIEGISIPFPQVVSHPSGDALRVQLMNDEPLPVATIWVFGFDPKPNKEPVRM